MKSATFSARLSHLLTELGTGPVFVHSDAFRVASLVARTSDKKAYIASHVGLIQEAAGDRGLWVPTFNYDFPRTQSFSVAQTPSELGPITEHFRVEVAEWRTPIPVFSVSGTGPDPKPEWGHHTDPFGPQSIFARLVAEDGVLLYYGDTFQTNTIVHHAESSAGGGPRYRYDKIFRGNVTMADGRQVDGSLRYHVRPLGSGLDYDWPRLLEEAIGAGVCVRLRGYPQILASPARALVSFWERELRHDPLALLDEKSRTWVAVALEQSGRRFEIGDFEAPDFDMAGRA